MMLGAGLIVFRETLEAALFVGIVAATTRGLANRGRWLAAGVAAGAAGSLVMASVMDHIAAWAEGLGQDVVTATILCVALAMLAWHCVWVSTHSREMVEQARRIGATALKGTGSLWALAIAIALCVLREGAETVLFVGGLLSGPEAQTGSLLTSAGLGLVLGALLGWAVYRGLGRVSPRRLFSITNGLILLLAGGLASQLAKTLNQADWVTAFGERAWDVSAWVANDSALGMLLRGLAGFDASPTRLQLVFYFATVLAIGLAARHMKARVAQRPLPVTA